MRVRSRLAVAALAVAALAVAACVINPDSRSRSVERAATDGRGGWIVLSLAFDVRIEGELIAADSDGLRVLTAVGLVTIPLADVVGARLWAWEAELSGNLVWGTVGTASTASHGFFLILTAPVWIGATALITAIEARRPIIEYPEHGIGDLARWARFPQGVPSGVHASDVIHQDRAPVGSEPASHGPPGGAPAAPAPTPGAPGSGSSAGSGAGSDSP